ncbi:beta-lactamase [Ktedonobacter racemifer DSM 44963]|uniref:Beta-lactamase n=2 Tax=Ktedonobacter racemifer TaxID=363277 RepID=D6TVN8_KTERA|nr:beta-lactamase [Ktedonobacter racemifer DSM 44963]
MKVMMTLEQQVEEKIDALFQAYNQEDTPGCAVGVLRDGELIFKRGYGVANLEHDVPITPRTVFCLASQAKQFTGMCIALLEEAGRLSLEDDIRKYLPEFPDYGPRITLAHLLHQCSGIRDYYVLALFMAGVKFHDYLNRDEALEILLAQRELIFQPGERFHYSNSNYFLLSLMIERITGQTLSQFSQKHIYEPLGMQNTCFRENHSLPIKQRATGYGRFPLRNEEPGSDQFDMGEATHFTCTNELELTGDDGVWSCIEDLALWYQNLSVNRLGQGRPELIERYLTPGRLLDGTSTGYAYGLCVGTRNGAPFIDHRGWTCGYVAVCEHYVGERLSLFILSNTSRLLPWEYTGRLRAILLDESEQPSAPVASRAPYILSKAERACVTGSYHCPENAYVWQIADVEGRLCVTVNGLDEVELLPREKHTFEISDGSYQVTVVPGKSGVHAHLEVSRGERTWTFLPFRSSPLSEPEAQAYAGVYHCEELATTYDVSIEDGRVCLRNRNRHRCGLDLAFEPTVGDLCYKYDSWVDDVVIEFQRDPESTIYAFVFRSHRGDACERLRFERIG